MESEQHKQWSVNKRRTREMTIRQAARKANIKFEMGFQYCYLDGKRTEFKDAREIIGKALE